MAWETKIVYAERTPVAAGSVSALFEDSFNGALQYRLAKMSELACTT